MAGEARGGQKEGVKMGKYSRWLSLAVDLLVVKSNSTILRFGL
jgi:hypothetical protein